MVIFIAFAYFLPNVGWSTAMALGSISQFTIVTETICAFVLIFDSLWKRRIPNRTKLVSVAACLVGVFLYSYAGSKEASLVGGDSESDVVEYEDAEDEDFASSNRELYALLCAFFFVVGTAMYQVFWDHTFDSTDGMETICTVLGFVGIANVLLLWPVVFLGPWFGLATFALPGSMRDVLCVFGSATLATGFNIVYMNAMAEMSAQVVSVTMLLLIPVSVIMDVIFEPSASDNVFESSDRAVLSTGLMGCAFIVIGFLGIVYDEGNANRKEMEGKGGAAYTKIAYSVGDGADYADDSAVEMVSAPEADAGA